MTLAGDPPVADAVQAALRDTVTEPRMGRRLPGLLAEAGFTDIATRAVAVVPPWPVHDVIVRTPTQLAIEAGTLEPASTHAWLADQERPGALTSIHVGVLASATCPQGSAA